MHRFIRGYYRRTALLLLIVLLAALLPGAALAQEDEPTPTPIPPGENNLLTNPSFEDPYYEWVEPGLGNGFIAQGWSHWFHLDENGKDGQYKVPEWKPVYSELEPVRVRDGAAAQVYFKKWADHIAGVYQVVEVPENSSLRFTAWGMAWSTHIEPPQAQYDSFAGGQPNYVYLKIGIDPTGGTNWASPDIFWSEIKTPLDAYDQFVVEAQAQGDTVTVWIWSSPQYPASTVDVFWDDAGLFVIGEGAPASTDPGEAAPAGSGSNSLEGVTPATPQPPREDGSQWHVVQPLDSVLRIAAAYDVEPQTIRELNDLTTDTLFVEQELLIIPAGQEPEPTPTATPESTESAEAATPTEEDAAPEADAVAEAAAAPAQICLALFEDANQDGLWGQGEALLSGGRLTLGGEVSANTATETGTEPTCFSELPPGDYTVAVQPPQGYQLVGGSTPLAVSVSEGSEIALNVGAITQPEQPAEEAPAPAPAEVQEDTPLEPPGSGSGLPPLVVGLLIAGGGLILTAGVTGFIVLRSSKPS